MDPGKQESVSRQSSILKPTKQRQPLQCVASNPESSESSPTVKIKRRVSFAKNKHVRKFCNETEQGPVYDDTYEEHDSSSTRSNSTGGNDVPLTITVPCHDKENFPVQLFLQTDEIACKEVPVNVPNENGDELLQCDMEMDNTLVDPDLRDKDNNCTDTTVYCDDGMDLTTYVPSRIIACHNQDSDFLGDKTPIDFTENLPSAPCKNSTEQLSNQNNLLKNNAANSTDLTVAISQLLGAGQANKVHSDQAKFPNISYNTEARLNSSNTVPMEFTSMLPSSTWIRPNSLCHSDKKTENFDNQTMEFTLAVPHTNIHKCQNVEKIDLHGKTRIFADTSMELTEAVPLQRNLQTIDKDNETEIFTNKSIEMTEAIPAYIKNREDKTQYFNDKSIEITEAIPVCIKKSDGKQNATSLEPEINKTNIFANKSMEITEAIDNYRKNHRSVQEKTEIFHNFSMETTEAIPNRIQTNINFKNLPNKASEETSILVDKSMELTESISICNKINKQPDLHSEETTERTNVNSDKSVELTKSIPDHYKLRLLTSGNSKVSEQVIQDKTNVFNKSMEMTEAVPIRQIYQPDRRVLLAEETEKGALSANVSMEMTEAVPVQKIYNYPKTTSQEELSEKSTVFANLSMEMTEAVPAHKIYGYPKTVSSEEISEKTTVFANLSMEMTEAVPAHNIYDYPKTVSPKEIPEKTTVFANLSMEMTEAVPAHKIYDYPKPVSPEEIPEKTTVFANLSMEMTEAIPNIHAYREKLTSKLLPESTKINFNDSMEMTEAVPNNIVLQQPKIAEITDKVLVYNTEYELSNNVNKIQQKSLDRRSKSLYNKPTEITESLACLTTKEYQGKSIPQESLQERTEYFANQSMTMTEIVNAPSNLSNCKTKPAVNNRTKMFENNSMNISETTPIQQAFLPTKTVSTGHPTILSDQLSNLSTISLQKSCSTGLSEFNERPTLYSTNPSNLIHRVSTIPASSDIDRRYLESRENLQVLEPIAMELTTGLSANISEVDRNKKICSKVDETNRSPQIISEKLNPYCNKSKTLSDVINAPYMPETINKKDNNAKLTSYNQPCNSTKIFQDGMMELTGLTSAVGAGVSQSSKLNVLDPIQSSLNVSNNFDSLREEPFHRITSDELNTLCASMNLPVQKYPNESASAQNNSIPSCSNVSILRESLRNGMLFQHPNSILSMKNSMAQTPSKIFETPGRKNNSKTFEIMDFETDVRDISRNVAVDIEMSGLHSNLNNLDTSGLTILSKSMTQQLPTMEVDKTAEIGLKSIQQSFIAMETDKIPEIALKDPLQGPFNESKVVSVIPNFLNTLTSTKPTLSQEKFAFAKAPDSAITVNKCDKPSAMSISQPQPCHKIGVAALQNNIKISNCTTKTACSVRETNASTEHQRIEAHSKCTLNDKAGVVEIYHDVSMEVGKPSAACNKKRKSDETCENVAKKNPALYLNEVTYTSVPAAKNSSKDKAENNGDENSLSRLPSDSTEVLVATMGFKTQLAYPLIINDKTTIKISQKPVINQTYTVGSMSDLDSEATTNKTYVIDSNKQNEVEASCSINKPEQSCEITPAISNSVATGSVDELADDENVFKDTEIPSVRNPADENPLGQEEAAENDQHRSEIPAVESPVVSLVDQVQCNGNGMPHYGIPIVKSPSHMSLLDQVRSGRNGMHYEIPVVRSPAKTGPPGLVEELGDEDKENKEPGVKMNLFAEKYPEELEEIQPPSFLCSDSMQDDDLSDIVRLPDDDQPDFPAVDAQGENSNSSFFKANDKDKSDVDNNSWIAPEDENALPSCSLRSLPRTSSCFEKVRRASVDTSDAASSCDADTASQDAQKKSHKLSPDKESVERIDEPVTCEIEEEQKPPYLQLVEDLQSFEKRDDCIWSIRAIKPHLIAVDFITKSFVFVIRLNEMDNDFDTENIKKVETISRLTKQSQNILLKIVHNILLFKLNPSEIIKKYKMYEEIIPMLQYVSSEVISAINFMFDLERLSALNLFSVEEERIIFTVASRKANIILKVSVTLKMEFNEIGPEDIDVTCVLGDIRKNDIKQLIVNIKRDYKFFSRYIKDVKDYINVMEESMHLRK